MVPWNGSFMDLTSLYEASSYGRLPAAWPNTGWHQYVLPMVFTMNNAALQPLAVGVVSLMNTGDAAAAWNLMLAGASLSIVTIYIFTSKYFISGLTNGAAKG